MYDRKYPLWNEIEQDIIACFWPPSVRLKISHLKIRYQTGATPIREALSTLISKNLVTLQENCGFQVTSIHKDELAELYQTRIVIEMSAFQVLKKENSLNWEKNIIAASYQLEKLSENFIKSGQINWAEWEACHKDFCLAIISGHPLNHLHEFWESLYQKIKRYRCYWFLKNKPNSRFLKNNLEELRLIKDAALNKDENKLREALETHYGNFQLLFNETFRNLY